jgi:ABC-type xylose transport system permease subunit
VRHVLADRPTWVAALWLCLFGVFLGAWNGYLWNGNEIPGSTEINWVWQPTPLFAEQFLFGYALFLGGHLIVNRFYPQTLEVNRGEYLALWAVCGVASVLTGYASGLWIFYPILPALVALCLAALSKDRGEGALVVDRVHDTPIPELRFLWTLIIPLVAIPVYAAIVAAELRLEMNVLVVVTAGPISVLLFGWALYRLFTRGG